METIHFDMGPIFKKANHYNVLIGKMIVDHGVFTIRNADHILMFDLKILCNELEVVRNNSWRFKELYLEQDKYTVRVREQRNSGVLPINFSLRDTNYKQQKEEIFEYYKDQYIIFKPNYTYDEISGEYHKNVSLIDVVNIPLGLDELSEFQYVPNIGIKLNELEDRLDNNGTFSFDNYPSDINNELNCFICENYLFHSKEFKKTDYLSDGWKIDKNEFYSKVKIDKKNYHIIHINERYANGFFIEKKYLDSLVSNIFLENEYTEKIIHGMIDTDVENEIQFIQSLNNRLLSHNLCFYSEDIINVHTCIKSSKLTILAGMSGVGKTKLAINYANQLDATEENGRLLFVPITSSFVHNHDLLGYFNYDLKEYIPSETGLIEFMLNAQKEQNKMHVAIFDEMNLSQIEHWFSQFMSVLEKDDDQQFISLYNSNGSKNQKYPDRIQIGTNIIFIGTMNVDLTTKDLSDRLIDRTYIVDIHKMKFEELYYIEGQKNKSTGNEFLCDSFSMYESWKSTYEPVSGFQQREIHFFDELHSTIVDACFEKGVSFRMLNKIGRYLNNLPIDYNGNFMLDRKAALDLIISQTIIKKLNGPISRLGHLIGELDYSEEYLNNSRLVELFNEYREISDFYECKQCLINKAKDLRDYGYAR